MKLRSATTHQEDGSAIPMEFAQAAPLALSCSGRYVTLPNATISVSGATLTVASAPTQPDHLTG